MGGRSRLVGCFGPWWVSDGRDGREERALDGWRGGVEVPLVAVLTCAVAPFDLHVCRNWQDGRQWSQLFTVIEGNNGVEGKKGTLVVGNMYVCMYCT